jgi:hypothetical protein
MKPYEGEQLLIDLPDEPEPPPPPRPKPTGKIIIKRPMKVGEWQKR